MNKSEQIARLRLIRTRNIGPMTYSLLMRRYGSAEAAIAAIPTLAQRGGSKISLASIASVTAELESIDAADAVLLWRDSEYYPERLAQFDDAPACITARGNLHLLTQPMIAIVGARNASINAQRHAHNIASELGKHGYIIVSGIARGIDAAAHRGALDTGTIGVIAGGIDIVYPPENADLFEEVASRGLLLAEMPPATKPTPKHFPIRNRVIASLAVGVVVAEAAHRSGSLITAREAATRGSDVMAVPGSPLDPRLDGCNRLIRDGATLVQNVADVIECVSRQPAVRIPPAQFEWTDSMRQTIDQTAVDRCRQKLAQDLSLDPVDIDELISWCEMPAPVVWAAILELEIAGIVTRHYGNRVARIAQQSADK